MISLMRPQHARIIEGYFDGKELVISKSRCMTSPARSRFRCVFLREAYLVGQLYNYTCCYRVVGMSYIIMYCRTDFIIDETFFSMLPHSVLSLVS